MHFSATRWLLPFCGMLIWVGSAAASSAESSPCGVLWRVESASTPPSYLFGTIHSEDPRVLDLPGVVTDAFEGSSTYVMELIPDFAAMGVLIQTMYFQDQRNLKLILGEALFEQTVVALEAHGIGAGMALKLKPWAAAVTLSFPKPETGMFLDLMLYNRAMRHEKTVIGLETAEEQLEFFTDLSAEQQIALLKATLEHQDEMYEAFEKLILAWVARDPDVLLTMNQEYLAELPKDVAQRFRQEAIIGRNHQMAERLQPVLREGNAFIAVGALHLYGPQGLLSLIEGNGRTVECVY